MNRKSAVEFSFLLAIPTMAAATALDVTETQASFTPENIAYLLTGLVLSFIVAFVVMKWFVNFIQHHSFVWFGVYRIVFAILYFLIITL